MNLTELSDLLSSATDVLRVETLDAYSSPSDADYLERFRRGEPKPDLAEKQPWLDRLAAAAERGRPWQRLRVVSRPVPEYVRYACEWGYVDNTAAGEDVRITDRGSSTMGDHLLAIGDFYVLDGEVVNMQYLSGRFSHAWAPRRSLDSQVAANAWRWAEPFTDWWADNPHLHRDLSVV